jgi:hypothetical protein
MKGKFKMAVEYSYPLEQTVAQGSNVAFLNGNRCCKKGIILHNDASGVFRIKGITKNGCCRALYKVNFAANVAVSAADGGVLEPISIALTQNGEVLNNAVATITPAAIGDFWNVSINTLLEIPCGCCDQISIRNTSATTAIDVVNANIIFERVA